VGPTPTAPQARALTALATITLVSTSAQISLAQGSLPITAAFALPGLGGLAGFLLVQARVARGFPLLANDGFCVFANPRWWTSVVTPTTGWPRRAINWVLSVAALVWIAATVWFVTAPLR